MHCDSKKSMTAKDALMTWVNRNLHTSLSGINIRDFAHSWKDGRAFLGLLHTHL
jgi:hypothetical protein